MCIVLIMRRQSHARMIIPFLSGKNYLPTKYWSRKCIFLPSSSLFKVMSIRIATWWKESSKLSSELKMKEKNDSIFEDRTERGFWVGGWHKVLRYPSPTPLFFFFLHPVCLVCLVFRGMKNTPGWTPAVNHRRETKPPRANYYSFLSDESLDLWPPSFMFCYWKCWDLPFWSLLFSILYFLSLTVWTHFVIPLWFVTRSFVVESVRIFFLARL